MIVITGATGQLGRLVIDGLLEKVPAERVAAVVRDRDRAADLAARGVQLRIADYDRPETLRDAFRAGEKVLLISGTEAGRRVPQHTAVVDAARRAGVALLAYTSVLGGPEADFLLADDHRETERVILGSGLPHVLLRNGWYHENYTGQLATALEHGAVLGSAGEGRIASASRADFAAAAVAVLTGEGHENRAYELSGDVAWSLAEYAAEVTRLSGREVVYRELPPAAYQEVLVGAGVPEPMAAILVDVDAAIARGRLAGTSGDLRRLIGRPTTPLADAIAAALKG
ncbi:SDR family oxidoreductase [Allostreptomyces psammosilenae]|uniref:NAD(P)H dehydrogenase (Quinone) n=1 Tax=Allostreptomyces psammosilenae TaxID=1892865 RepID=A0A853A0E7_9ACTN|nr:SDR family oxidoreductase [Allostreptomyces psammosilenae]NYI04291.1 NAD(P)H dehydrogenase (quinone) [Allostreptomyces psammosilenae]